MAEPLLIFTHIPKTGGLTMRRIIDRHFAPHQIFKYSTHTEAKTMKKPRTPQIARTRCVYGHCRFGVHQYFNKPFKYITMLRDPVERIISTYYFIRSSPSNKMHNKVKNMSFEEFVFSNDPKLSFPLNNHQTRFLSGEHNPDLNLALENVRKHFLFVGITELYPHSVFLLNRLMGWKQEPYTKENVTRSKPKTLNIPPNVMEYIKKNNEMDDQLYQYCKKRLLRRIRELRPQAKQRLDEFVLMHQPEKNQGRISQHDDIPAKIPSLGTEYPFV
jgi:hypothetical protein